MTELWPKSLGEGGDRGVSSLWTNVNHIAITVSDVGRSLAFYTDIVGMKQVLRPNFDRHGAWMTFGNVDLHLIKGKPAVHNDDDLIVCHIAISVPDMPAMKKRLEELDTKYRVNISVPNPDSADGLVTQAFVRDPDGYYIEFCDCEKLDKFIHSKATEYSERWDLYTTATVIKMGPKLRTLVLEARTRIGTPSPPARRKYPSQIDENPNDIEKTEVAKQADPKILETLKRRRKIYGDIMQNVDSEEVEALLLHFNNNVPKVIGAIECRVQQKGTRTFIPPAFYARDGTLFQPPSFEMPCTF